MELYTDTGRLKEFLFSQLGIFDLGTTGDKTDPNPFKVISSG